MPYLVLKLHFYLFTFVVFFPLAKFELVVIAVVGDPRGVRCCYTYGDSFLQVKSESECMM